MSFRSNLSRRDAFLVLLGACSMQIWSYLFQGGRQMTSQSTATVMISQSGSHPGLAASAAMTRVTLDAQIQTHTGTQTTAEAAKYLSAPITGHYPSFQTHITHPDALPPTTVLAHAPGWTLFQNLYMSNGTLFLVIPNSSYTPSKGESYGSTKIDGVFPEIRMMTSTGLTAANTPESIAQREPTEQQMRFLSVHEAAEMWGKVGEEKRVWTVEGNTLLFNDPSQFLRHYYHFVAELFLGVQAFWHGAFSSPSSHNPKSPIHFNLTHPAPPPIQRAIFIHSNADGWRDDSGLNSYFLRAALPSLTVEHQEDWGDRVDASIQSPLRGEETMTVATRAWHFPLVLLTDRSAAHRGLICGSQTQRTAAEAWDYMRGRGTLKGIHVGGWWAPMRESIWRFAGARPTNFSVLPPLDEYAVSEVATTPQPTRLSPVVVGKEHQKMLGMPQKIVISYVTRQSAHKRKLVKEDHEVLVAELKALVTRLNAARVATEEKKKKTELVEEGNGNDGKIGWAGALLEWELQILEAERMTKDEQVRAAARTTILLGVHGNGLTHLVFMQPTRVSTVIEIFCPPGFAHDYQWTARALGMAHFTVWNDTYYTHPKEPDVNYPDCFQGDSIPVHGPTVARLIEAKVLGKL